MSSGWEKSVKGATKIKLAAPKSKYIEHILISTHTGEAGVAEIFRFLQNRLRDSTWTIVFKSLIVVHFMIREGQEDVTLSYLSKSPQRKLAINNFTEVQTQGRNIRTYADYLTQRAASFESTKRDYVRRGHGRLKSLTVDKGLLRETEAVQDQIRALCRCDFLSQEPENEITLTAFRLLTMDLLALFHVMNEGTISVLEHFFEMSKSDAERALKIYRAFVKQTEQVVRYLSIARHYDHATRLEIPKIKHAPTSLTGSLEEYVKDPDFEVNRRQYVAQQEYKKTGTNGSASTPLSKASIGGVGASTGASKPTVAADTKPRGPPPALIDFFGSIETSQETMAQAPPQQQQVQQFNGQMPPQVTGFQPNPFVPQQMTGMPVQQPQQNFGAQVTGHNPFLQMQMQQQQQQQQTQQMPQQQIQQQFPPVQQDFTGGQLGAFSQQQSQPQRFQSSLQPIPQSNVPTFQPQAQPQQLQQPFATGVTDASGQSTNPFRQSMLPPVATGGSFGSFGSSAATPLSSQATSSNPFAMPQGQLDTGSPFTANNSPFSQQPAHNGGPFSQQQQTGFQPQQQSLMPQATGANPFAKPAGVQAPSPFGQAAPLSMQATGSTNPFRQSAFVNQSTGMGWQTSTQQGTIGGIPSDQVQTQPVFPRPGMGPTS